MLIDLSKKCVVFDSIYDNFNGKIFCNFCYTLHGFRSIMGTSLLLDLD